MITNFNRVWASVVSSQLAKTAYKSGYPFGWNFDHWQTDRQTDRHTTHTHTHTHTQTHTHWQIKFRGNALCQIVKINLCKSTKKTEHIEHFNCHFDCMNPKIVSLYLQTTKIIADLFAFFWIWYRPRFEGSGFWVWLNNKQRGLVGSVGKSSDFDLRV